MALFRARMLDSLNGNEGSYEFEYRDDLIAKPADEMVAAFFEYAERELFRNQHIEYELNGAVKNRDTNTVVAIGALNRVEQRDEPPQPFTLFIGPAS